MRRNIILIIGVIVASIITTKSFALGEPNLTDKKETEVDILLKDLKENPDFSMFYKALKKSGVSNDLLELEEFTILIPSNRAFKMLPKDVYENFLDPENKDQLKKLITYHIIEGKITEDDIREESYFKSLSDTKLNVTSPQLFEIEDSKLEEKIKESENTVYYRVDQLIMPL